MRINWKSPLATAALIMPCLIFFFVMWPVGTSILLHSMLGAGPNGHGKASALTFFAMVFVGFFLGIHVGMMIEERALWLQSKVKRTVFLLVSGMCAACITYINSTGGVADQKGPANYVLMYFFAVQGLPLLWFLYNMHGASWMKAFAQRRSRGAQ